MFMYFSIVSITFKCNLYFRFLCIIRKHRKLVLNELLAGLVDQKLRSRKAKVERSRKAKEERSRKTKAERSRKTRPERSSAGQHVGLYQLWDLLRPQQVQIQDVPYCLAAC